MVKTTKFSFNNAIAVVIAISAVSSSLLVNSLTIPDPTNNEGRALDSIGGGNILRAAHAGSPPRGSLDSIGGGNILRGIDSIGGGNILRALDSIGGGNILRGRQIDSIGGGNILRDTDKFRVHSKRNFDEIGNGSGWGRFVRKRNFDEIDGGRGFGSRFAKKAFDEIDGHGFGRFARNFDEIEGHGFGRFV